MARNLMARCWVSAHDEEKENSGIIVKKVTMRRYGIGEVRAMLDGTCNVRNLGVGEELNLRVLGGK